MANIKKKSIKSTGFILLETLMTMIIVGFMIGVLLKLQGNLVLQHTKLLEKAKKMHELRQKHEEEGFERHVY